MHPLSLPSSLLAALWSSLWTFCFSQLPDLFPLLFSGGSPLPALLTRLLAALLLGYGAWRLHTTPLEYLRNYRLQQACRMLTQGQETITAVSHACGLGSSSYFGSVFKDCFGCSPMEYRRKWQDCDITRQV